MRGLVIGMVRWFLFREIDDGRGGWERVRRVLVCYSHG